MIISTTLSNKILTSTSRTTALESLLIAVIMPKQHIEEFGWLAVPRDRSNIPSKEKATTTPTDVDFDQIWPRTDVVMKAQEFVQKALPHETYNHSLRVFCYGAFAVHMNPYASLFRIACGFLLTSMY